MIFPIFDKVPVVMNLEIILYCMKILIMIEDIVTIRNYKCFDEEGCQIGPFNHINVLIGKNNAGKSSIIEVLKFLSEGDGTCYNGKRDGRKTEIIVDHEITETKLDFVLSSPAKLTGVRLKEKTIELKSFVFKNLQYLLNEGGVKEIISIQDWDQSSYRYQFQEYLKAIDHPYKGLKVLHLTAERDIRSEFASNKMEMASNGTGLTNIIRQLINVEGLDQDVVEITLLEKLNRITNPEIDFTRILVQSSSDDVWEINFEQGLGRRIPISKMGSGVKTILQVLVMLYVIPKLDGRKITDYIFAFEELENNLHPAMQRKLYDFLYKFAVVKRCKLFLTTHSHVGIDYFSTKDVAQIIHVQNRHNKATIDVAVHIEGLKKILDDLDVRASDILQSNGIIWVEGPSDRTYINKWLSLIDPTLIEGFHYSIMFYGGRLLSNLKLDYDHINEDLIPLLRLNRNAFVVFDRDGKNIDTKLNDTKRRIAEEIGGGSTWITRGREIENYLSDRTITKWLDFKKQAIAKEFVNNKDSKIQESILLACPATKIDYAKTKNKFACEIRNFIAKDDLEELDLKTNLSNMADSIRRWNRI